MSNSTPSRDAFLPRPPKGRGAALALALVAHVLLVLGLAFGVHWRSSEPTTMAAELWSAVPQAAAPRAVEPEPSPVTAPPEARKPDPVIKPAEPVAPPKPQTPALPDPQIAIEKARREEAKRAQAEQEQQQKAEREKAEREKQRALDDLAQKKAAADKLKADKEKADKAEATKLAAARNDYMKRMQGLAGATGGPADTGTAIRSSGPSASYAGRIMARIKPNIVFNDTVDGNPKAVVEVNLAPDGTIVAKRLIQSSGVKSWDDAVLRAIERTEVLPRDVDGRVPPQFEIGFRPRD